MHSISTALRVYLYLLSSFLFLAASAQPLAAQETLPKNTEGTEFWICFQRNYRDEELDATTNQLKRSDPLTLELFVIARQTTKMRVEIEALGYSREFDVRADAVLNIKIDTAAQVTSNERPERKAIHITSEEPITVYGLSRRFQTTDTYLGLPVQTLGTRYRVMAYERLSTELVSQLAVIGTEDNTQVTIVPTSVTMSGKPPQTPFTITLNRGEVYQLIAGTKGGSKADLTGSEIISTKPVSVFSGHNCAYIPTNLRACNHLVEQIPPVESWGTQFYVGSFKNRSRYTVRVMASQTNTKIFENSRLVAELNPGQFYENSLLKGNNQYTADKPVLVAQFAQGFMNGDSIGDPMMILVSPTQQFLRRYRFATPVNGAWQHYINVVIPADKASTLRLDGVPVPLPKFEPFGTSSYSIAQLEVPYGTHTLEAEVPFGMYSYGFGFSKDAYDAYGNIGGQSFEPVRLQPDTSAPYAVVRDLSAGYRLVVRDDRTNDKGLKSISVEGYDGLDINTPGLVEGVPQVELQVIPAGLQTAGSAVLVMQDAAGNISRKSICYNYHSGEGRWKIEVKELGQCDRKSSLRIGPFLASMYQSHSAGFTRSGPVQVEMPFDDKQDFATGGGLSVEWALSDEWTLFGRLSIAPSNTSLTAPDTSLYPVVTPEGDIVRVKEQAVLDVPAPSFTTALGAQYYFGRYFYVLAGAQFDYQFSNRAEQRARLIEPPDFRYDNGQSERIVASTELTSLNRFRPGIFGGVGLRVPVVSRLSASAELHGVYTPGSYVSDADWNVAGFRFHLGLLWEF